MSASQLSISLALAAVAVMAEVMVVVKRGSYRVYDLVIIAGIIGIGAARIGKYLRRRTGDTALVKK